MYLAQFLIYISFHKAKSSEFNRINSEDLALIQLLLISLSLSIVYFLLLLNREAWNCNITSLMEVLRKPLRTDVVIEAHAIA